jgi:hypothetical protein
VLEHAAESIEEDGETAPAGLPMGWGAVSERLVMNASTSPSLDHLQHSMMPAHVRFTSPTLLLPSPRREISAAPRPHDDPGGRQKHQNPRPPPASRRLGNVATRQDGAIVRLMPRRPTHVKGLMGHGSWGGGCHTALET